MKCIKCRRLLMELSEGQLEGASAQSIREHLAGCDSCRRELYGLQSSMKLMDDAKRFEAAPEAPADFAERIMDRVQRGVKSHFPFRRLVSGIVAVCFVLAIGAISLFYTEPWEKQNPAPRPDNNVLSDADTASLYHAKMELVRLLGQTLEIIERGEKEWEIEM
jgi:anti-sigma factor RsiW